MEILGKQIPGSGILGKSSHEMKKRIKQLEQKLQLRPGLGLNQGRQLDAAAVPTMPVQYPRLYEITRFSNSIATIFYSIRREIFKNGLEIEPRFAKKCTICHETFEHELEECGNCGSPELRDPSTQGKKVLEQLVKEKVNQHGHELPETFQEVDSSGQKLVEVAQEIEDDLQIADNGYMLILKDYSFNTETGEIVDFDISEILRGDPQIMRIVADSTGRLGYDDKGDQVRVCPHPEHREEKQSGDTCPMHGLKTVPAYYVADYHQGGHGYSATNQEDRTYYLPGEVVHTSKYNQSLLYGFPRIMSVWNKAHGLMNMDLLIRERFDMENRQPMQYLFAKTRTPESLRKTMEQHHEEMMQNPNHQPVIGIPESDGGDGKFIEKIDLAGNFSEMQLTEMRQEFRQQIGAAFGVMPVFQGDMSTSGGLNNEGLQITVTNRTVETGQKLWNQEYFEPLTDQLGVKEWELKLAPHEEKDEMAEIERDTAEARMAQVMQEMGFEVSKTPEGEFEFSDEPVNPPLDSGSDKPNTDLDSEGGQRFQGEPDIKTKQAKLSEKRREGREK